MCHKIGGIILNSTDNIIISMFLGLVVLAKYTNYYYVMNSVASLIIICFTGLTAGIGNSLKTESIEKNTDYFKKILFLNGYIVIVCGTLLFTLYQDFIKLWVGNDNLLPYIIMILFVVYFYVRMIRRTIIVFRDASGMWWDNKFQPIISAILNLSLNIILTKIIGLYGIITSTIISMLFIDIPWESIVFLRQKIKIKPKKYFYEIFCYFVVMVICCAICYVLNSFIVITSSLIIHLICNLIINFIVINLIVYILFCKNENYNYFRKMTISTARRFLKKKNWLLVL